MSERRMTKLEISQYNLRRALDFERKRLTDAEWKELCAWVRREMEKRTEHEPQNT